MCCQFLEIQCFNSVRMKGLEPIRLSSLDPKSSAATNYATSAGFCFAKIRKKCVSAKEKMNIDICVCMQHVDL